MSEGPHVNINGYVMVGVNHKHTPMALRDCLTLDDTTLSALLEHLRADGHDEALVLSTCDRVEICGWGHDPDELSGKLLEALCHSASMTSDQLDGHFIDLRGEAAVRHLFQVACALDSQMIGEPHVLGQVKAAHRLARDAGLAGPAMETVLQAAYGVAKRTRSETHIAERPVSLAASAVQIARDLHGELSSTKMLLLGTQEMGELIAEHLIAAGVGQTFVCTPRRLRAVGVAQRLGASIIDHTHLMDDLPKVDVVIVALMGNPYAISEEAVRQALRRRRNRPMFIIDVGVPANVQPGVDRLEAAYVYDLADLEGVASEGRASRSQASVDAGVMVEEALSAFIRQRAERQAVPAIIALRALFDVERRRALDEAPDDAEKATRLLVGRLLHAPSAVLRALAAEDDMTKTQAEAMLRRLFAFAPLEEGSTEKDRVERELGRKIGPGRGPA